MVQSDLFLGKNSAGKANLSETEKAAVIFHEAIYAYRRENGDKDSLRSRRIVGLLFSTLSNEEIRNTLIQLKEIKGGGFQTAYVEPKSGLKWSTPLPNKYANGCPGSKGQPNLQTCSRRIKMGKDSAAEQACENLGGRLPTNADYQALIRSFDHVEQYYGEPALTDSGFAAMKTAFKNALIEGCYWSTDMSSHLPPDRSSCFEFVTGYGTLLGDSRENPNPVLCVSENAN